MEKQTAVEFLMKFCLNDLPIEQWNKYNGLFQQAKEMEKEQIVEAFYQGVDQESDTHGAMNLDRKDAENYYNETFKN